MCVTLLRWSLALVLGLGAAQLIVSVVHGGHPGVPHGAALALAVAELAAAILFLVPRTVAIGGVALIGVLAVAAVLHAVVGQVPPASFLVYAAAIWTAIHPPRAVAS